MNESSTTDNSYCCQPLSANDDLQNYRIKAFKIKLSVSGP